MREIVIASLRPLPAVAVLATSVGLLLAAPAAAAPPHNDDFAASQLFSGAPVSVTGSNVEATREAGEPVHPSGEEGASVWYSWTAPSSGKVVVDTCGSAIDTGLGVYTGTAVGGLTETASNDYRCGWQSMLIFAATQGTTYRIAVDGLEEGDVALAISAPTLGCTISWDGGAATTSWSAAANWSENRQPGAGDDVCIEAGDVVEHGEWTETEVDSIAGAGKLILSEGELAIEASGDASIAELELAGGFLTGPGDVSVSEELRWTDGVMDGAGLTRISKGASLLIAREPSGLLQFGGNRLLWNEGAAEWSTGGIWVFGGGTPTIYNSGSFDATSEDSFGISTDSTLREAVFYNAGLFTKSSGQGETQIELPLVNDGTVRLTTGSLDVGPITASAGYHQTVDGVLETQVRGGVEGLDYGYLFSPGGVKLNGTLRVETAAAYVPAAEQRIGVVGGSFDLSDGNSGEFHTVDGLAIDDSTSWSLEYDGLFERIRLVAVETPLSPLGSLESARTATAAADVGAPRVSVRRRMLVARRGGVAVPIACRDESNCVVVAELRSAAGVGAPPGPRAAVLAGGRRTIANGRVQRLRLKLRRRARRLIRRSGILPAKLVVRAVDASGNRSRTPFDLAIRGRSTGNRPAARIEIGPASPR
jgi:hypothetical protein